MPKRVLIVDDEENIRGMSRLALESSGYEVGEAENGLEAFAIIGADESWDLVLLDQKMPGMIGIEVLRRLKVMLPAARVIMMTAYTSIDLAVEAMKLGASDFVRKPMTPEILRNAVAAALTKESEPHASDVADDRTGEQSRQMTLNGFTILRSPDILGLVPHKLNERAFIVRAPNGSEQQVVVEIAPEAISAVEKFLSGVPLETSFWTDQAEQFLSDFLWNDGNAPATGRLRLIGVDRGAVEKAVRREVTK
jgi:DNA-binding response OmpR family regulator